MKTKKKQNNIKKTVSNSDSDENQSTSNDSSESTSNSQFESSFDTSFFYTNDKFLNSFDDNDIFAYICNKYPNLSSNNTDTVIKRSFLLFLNDSEFIEQLFDYYDLTIYDFFKKIYSYYGSTMFKTQYIKKIKSAVEGKSYAKRTRHLSKKSN